MRYSYSAYLPSTVDMGPLYTRDRHSMPQITRGGLNPRFLRSLSTQRFREQMYLERKTHKLNKTFAHTDRYSMPHTQRSCVLAFSAGTQRVPQLSCCIWNTSLNKTFKRFQPAFSGNPKGTLVWETLLSYCNVGSDFVWSLLVLLYDLPHTKHAIH